MQTYASRKKAADDAAARSSALERGPGSAISNQSMLSALGHRDTGIDGAALDAAMQKRLAAVRVHYDSDRPARVHAQAYAQGDQVFLGPGQEARLPHELGHVLQQRQGHVPTTARVDGQEANTDPTLERQADALGRQYGAALPLCVGPVGSPDAGAPIQMAGHAGVMVFGRGKLMKRVEKNEYDQFGRVRDEQADGNEKALAAFPSIHGVYTLSQLQGGPVPEGYDPGKFNDWLSAAGDGDYFVEMESLGGAGVDIKDFKVGTTTANQNELLNHRHKNSVNAAHAKQKRMNSRDDYRTETQKYGLRDSDQIQRGLNPLRKMMIGQHIDTLQSVREQVHGRQYAPDSQIIQDIENIEDYFQNSNVVYIASSVIIQWHKDPGQSGEDRARLIDLAHPFSRDEFPIQFDDIQRGMLLGIRNVKNLLLGQELESAGGQATEAVRNRNDRPQPPQTSQQTPPGGGASFGGGATSQLRRQEDQPQAEPPQQTQPPRHSQQFQRNLDLLQQTVNDRPGMIPGMPMPRQGPDRQPEPEPKKKKHGFFYNLFHRKRH